MKAMTLHQPWSWAIAHAGKRVENRTWAPPASIIGQRVAIHAGLRLDKLALDSVRDAVAAGRISDAEFVRITAPMNECVRSGFVHGAVESVATIAGAITLDCSCSWGDVDFDGAVEAVESAWFMGPIGWLLTNVIALPEPVPCKGAQGLWTLPADVESAVLAQLGGVR